MFYDDATIGFLTERVKFAKGITPKTAIFVPLNDSTSKRNFKDFHQMATVENVYAAVPYADISDQDFEDYLTAMILENVCSVLTVVFDNEERANYRYCYNGTRHDISNIDYSATIQSKERLFDNLLGLRMAISCLELFLTTSRQNGGERSNKFDYNMLKQELEGVMSQDGTRILTKGLYTKFQIELEKVKNILLPVYSKRTVRGVSVW